MSNKINNFQIYTNSSIILFGLTVSLIVIYLFFPIFAGNFYYDIGTVLIYSGPIEKIPKDFALCDGTNNTPDLTNKFIIGAYTEDTIQKVESLNNNITNNDIPYIGPGLLVKNPDDDQSKNINNDLIPKAFSRGNLPYVFGTTYSDTYKEHSNRGTNFFKKYVYYEKDDLSCSVDENNNNTTIKQRYYIGANDINNTVEVCDNNKTILTDANLSDRQVKIITNTNTGTGTELENDDFDQYIDNNFTLTDNPQISETYTINAQGKGTGFKHIAVNRRLFRDFEDYTLYLNGQNSNYDILPMNKKYDRHTYDNSIYNEETFSRTLGEESIFRNGARFVKEYLQDFSYVTPYTNNPAFFKLAYIIKIK